MKVIKSLLLLGILGMLFLQVSCTTDSPVDPAANRPPDTFITNFTISAVANEDGSYTTIVYWRGTDEDGEIASYMYRLAGGVWTAINVATVTLDLDYPQFATAYSFEVKAIDNLDSEDPTPAVVDITRVQSEPTTNIISGPPNGAKTSTGVVFLIGGFDIDGTIAAVLYDIDNSGTWTEVATDETYSAELIFSGLTEGSHVFAFKAKDSYGNLAESASTVAIFVEDVFAPVFEQLAGPGPNGAWFAGQPSTFTWQAYTAHYYASLSGYSWAYNDATTNADGSLTGSGTEWVAWDGAPDVVLDMLAGDQMIYLAVIDNAGNITVQETNVAVVEATFDQGVLVVNENCSYGTYGTMGPNMDADAYWGTVVPGAFWDNQGGYGGGSALLPASSGDGPIPAGVLAQHSTVVWLGNGGAGPVFEMTALREYLAAGGNVIFITRQGQDYAAGNWIESYLDMDGQWRDTDAGASLNTLTEYMPMYPGLVAMHPFIGAYGQSRVCVFSSYQISGGGLDADDITNYDGATVYSRVGDEHHATMLFAHRQSPGTSELYTRCLSVWSHPNLDDPERMYNGNLIWLNSRTYGIDPVAAAHNFDLMLREMCGEQ